jgi:hypothetical protein
MNGQGFDLFQGQGFLSSVLSQAGSGAHPASYPIRTGARFNEGKSFYGLCQFGHSTAIYALLIVDHAAMTVCDTWTFVQLTAAKFKPLIFSVWGFALSNIA